MTLGGSDRPVVAAVDLGGTKIAAAMVDDQGRCGPAVTRPTPAHEGPERVLDAVADAVREAAEAAGTQGPRAVGVGAAGIFDTATGTVVSATDAITGWPGTPVAELLARRVDVPVVVDNDVNAHAAGECWRGAGRDARSTLMVTVGTGVGGAIVLDGRPLQGARGVGGEVGHMPARGAEHLRCGCGKSGHLEAVACGPGMVRHYRYLGGDPEITEARTLAERAGTGDELSCRAVTESAQALGTALAGLVTTVDPDVVVLGGGVSEIGPLWWDPVERTMRAELLAVVADVPLRAAELGATAALVGAAHRAWAELDTGADGPAPPGAP